MITCKGTDKDMKCRVFQYKLRETVEMDGPIEVCKSGVVDGKNVKSDTLYKLVNGEPVEVEEDEK